MIKKTFKANIYQQSEGALTLNQFENELGTITDSVRERSGKYILTIPNAFEGMVDFFCPQNKQLFNVVGMSENSFILDVQIISNSEIQISTFDQLLNYWEDNIGYIPLTLECYFPDFLPTE